jgi:hypothetical protein
MKLTLEKTWAFNIAGETFTIDPALIPQNTFIAIVKDRLMNKGRDTWADSSKVSGDVTRQSLWADSMDSVYDGSWIPGISSRGPRKKNMDKDTFIHNESIKKAKAMLGKTGFKDKSGRFYKPDSKSDMADLAAALMENAKWLAVCDAEWDKVRNSNDLDI